MQANQSLAAIIDLLQELNLLINSMLLSEDRTSLKFIENRRLLDEKLKLLETEVAKVQKSDAAFKLANQTIKENATEIKTS